MARRVRELEEPWRGKAIESVEQLMTSCAPMCSDPVRRFVVQG